MSMVATPSSTGASQRPTIAIAFRATQAHQRRRADALAAAMAFGVFWLVWILGETVRLGLGGLSLVALHRDDAAAQPKAAAWPTRSSAR